MIFARLRSTALAAAIVLLGAAARAEDDAERIRRAVAHTIATQKPDGMFRYDFDFLAAEPSGDDNIVRQAGTLFSLGAYLVDTGDRTVVAPLEAGLSALAQRSLPIGTGSAQAWLESAGVFRIASWRLERALAGRGWLYAREGDGRVISGDASYAGVYTGATALALIAELELRSATGEERFAAERAGWLRGLLALRVPGGGIRDNPETLHTSSYPDGETWLALSHYHDAFPADAEAARALTELESYLLDHYRDEPDKEFYHWGAMTCAARLARGDAARRVEFAAGQAEFVLRVAPPEKKPDENSCALLEGLASSLVVIRSQPGREDLVTRLEERVALELARNRAFQIGPGQRQMALGGGGQLQAPSLAGSSGAFLAGRYRAYTRTDLTQHCISAFLIAKRHGLGDRQPDAGRARGHGENR
jgi:hypothetical protein